MSAKKKATRKTSVPRPRNGGQWTEARYNSFIKSALRGARWPAKYECIKRAFVENGINPETGKKCKLCRCEGCKKLFKQGDLRADHILPVVGPEGFQTWDIFISRLYCEADGFQALCSTCHDAKTAEENGARRNFTPDEIYSNALAACHSS